MDFADPQARKKITWDGRWLDAAIKADQHPIVCALALPNHKAALDYLLKQSESKKASDPGLTGLTVCALARCKYPKVTELFLDPVTKKTKSATYLDFDLQILFESARHLPAADLPKLDEFAAKLDEKFVDAFLEALAPLRKKTPA